MKKTTFLLIIGLLTFNLSNGQDREKYSKLINEAWGLYQSGDYLESAQTYSAAFVALDNKGMVNDRYNAACSYALANKIDSSFVQLFKISKKGNYINYGHITTDPDLKSLYSDERWDEVLKIVKANKYKAEANFDKELVAILETIHQEDQKYRRQIEGIANEFGWKSDEMKAHWEIIKEKDSLNLIKIKKILDERGWLGADIIGKSGNSTLFLVIQHADLETQLEYLPMMREAVKKGNARPSSLALLEDRVALRQGKKQIYGSQIGRDKKTGEYYVLPLKDPENVDKRRAEVGLGPLQNYVSNWDMTWNVEKYKNKLPEIIAKQKK